MASDGGHVRIQIYGLVGDVIDREMRQPVRPTAYVPFHAIDAKGSVRPIGRGTFVVRTSSRNPLALASTLRREVSQARPGFWVSNIRTQTELNQQHTVRERLLATLALFFAVVALLLAESGSYEFSTTRAAAVSRNRYPHGDRRPERRYRASRDPDVFTIVAAGALAGLALGVVSTRYIETLFYEVKPTDVRLLARLL